LQGVAKLTLDETASSGVVDKLNGVKRSPPTNGGHGNHWQGKPARRDRRAGMFFRSILIAVAVDHHSAVRLPVALLDNGSVSGLIA
jgi:hypothetical protein